MAHHYQEQELDTHPGVRFILRVDPQSGEPPACVGVAFGSDPAIMVSPAVADDMALAPWRHAKAVTEPRLRAGHTAAHPAGATLDRLGLPARRARERDELHEARIADYLVSVREHMTGLRRRTSTLTHADLGPRLWAEWHAVNVAKNQAHQTLLEQLPAHMRAALVDDAGAALGQDAAGDEVVELADGWFKATDLTAPAQGEVAPHWRIAGRHMPRWSVDVDSGHVTLSVNGADDALVAHLHGHLRKHHGERIHVRHHRDHAQD